MRELSFFSTAMAAEVVQFLHNKDNQERPPASLFFVCFWWVWVLTWMAAFFARTEICLDRRRIEADWELSGWDGSIPKINAFCRSTSD